ncbi:MAG: hypothetical protein A2W31_09700, partial [Planctomycetes bacterium RBG_16_64_10]
AGQTMPLATLGRTGVQVSRLGLGCAHFQRPHVRIDDVTAVLHRAVELGVNYLDTAPNYGAGPNVAEQKMGPAVREIRDRLFLVTKTEEPTYEGTWRLLRQSLTRLQTDHLDLVHLHNFGQVERFPDLQFTFSKRGAFGALEEAKKQGVVRFIGASGHVFPARFHAALDSGGIDVLMNAVNYVVQHVYDFEHKIWCRARHENIGLVAMKVLGGAGPGGTGFQLPTDSYEWAMRYALSIPGLACAVVGIENTTELEQAVATTVGFKPFTPAEAHTLAQRGLTLAADGDWPQVYGQPVD